LTARLRRRAEVDELISNSHHTLLLIYNLSDY
jgi:hypothetical protein